MEMKNKIFYAAVLALFAFAARGYAYPCDSAGDLGKIATCLNNLGVSGSMTAEQLHAIVNPYFYLMVLNADAGSGYQTPQSSAPFLSNCYLVGIGCADVPITFPVAQEGKPYKVQVRVYNLGASGTMRIEAMIQTKDTLKAWGIPVPLSIVNSVPNCVPTQQNVGTVEVNVPSGGSQMVEIIIPQVPAVGMFGSITGYYLFVDAYNKCAGSGVDFYITSVKYFPMPIHQAELVPVVAPYGTPTQKVPILGDLFPQLFGGKESCTDGIKNQDETGVDCGGSKCAPCPAGPIQQCIRNSDCATSYCSVGRCVFPPVDGSGNPDYCKYSDNPVKCVQQRYQDNSSTITYLLVVFIVFAVAFFFLRRGR